MLDVSIALIFNLLALAAIGLGPSLYLITGEDRGRVALWISPVAGFAVTSIIGTYSVLLDCPIMRGGPLILIAGMTLSAALTVAATFSGGLQQAIADRWELVMVAVAFFALCALTMAPQIVGGLNYSILRGNGTDSFNYVTTAGYLDHEPISWASDADVRTLVERHPSYERARRLLDERWTTAMMLAFTSRMGGVPPYKFEYFFSVLCFLLAFGPAYLFCRDLFGLGTVLSILTAVAVCGGFWAQLILDTRANSQMNAIPVLLLLVFLICRMEGDGGTAVWRREIGLIAAALASLVLFYPEILPMTVLGGALFVAIGLWRGLASMRTVFRLTAPACLALIVVLPTWRLLLSFLSKQVGLASVSRNNWERAYFPWLYSSPLIGIWGLSPLAALRPWLMALCTVAGAVLTTVLIAGLVRAFSNDAQRRPGIPLAATIVVASLAQWAYLCSRGQLWAGGKGLSFGYPFLILTVGAYAFRAEEAPSPAWRRRWAIVAKVSVGAMLAVQCFLVCVRPVMAYRGWEYSNYIMGHGEYKRHDWNMASFAEVLRSHKGTIVWSDLSNPWLADYFGLVFGWDDRVINVGTSRDSEEFQVPQPPLDRAPEFVLVENSMAGISYGNGVAAHNSELSLVKIDGVQLPILDIANPNGVERGTAGPFFWLGTKPAILTVLSTTRGMAQVSGRFMIGPSNPSLRAVDVVISSNASLEKRHLRIEPGYQQFAVPTAPPLTRLTIRAENPAIQLLPGDLRPLLLRVDELRLQRGECQPDARGR